MTTQYTPILKLALPVQGELSGTWGDVVNDNITSMIEQAIAGRVVVNTWTTNSHVLTSANGLSAESRAAMLSLTDSTTALNGAGSVICPALSKTYIVKNSTAQIITVKTSSGTGIAVPVGKTMLVFCDGTNVLEGVDHVVTLSAGVLTIGGGTSVNYIDTDGTFTANSDDRLATQKATKLYVDTQIGTADTLSEVLALGNTTGGTDIVASTTDKVQFRDAAIYINSSADGQLDLVADTEVQITAPTVDLNGLLDLQGTLNIGTGGATVNLIDNGDVATNSAVRLATQQAVKTYVDNNAGTEYTAGTGLDLTGTEFSLEAATATVDGGVQLFSDTVQTVASASVTATASRTYGIQLNSDGQAVVNVPWAEGSYVLPAATSTALGGVELFSDTDQSVAANSVTTTANRTYGIQLNSANQAVVNVPWVNTEYTAGTGLDLTNTEFSIDSSVVTLTGSQALSNKSGVISQWTNDSGYSTPSSTDTFTNKSGDISQWTNDSGYTTNVGDITGVTAGNGLTGGGSTGAVTLTVGASTGIQVFGNAVQLKQATSSERGGIQLFSNTDQSVAANSVTTTAGRTYGIQLNSANQAVVNVPWVGGGGAGDITSVIAGTGMTGGATSGDATLNVIGGDGITANADDIAVDSTVVRTSGTQSIGGGKAFGNILSVDGGETGGYPLQRLTSSSVSTYSRIEFGYTGTVSQGKLQYDNSSDSMTFSTDTAERARITSAGDLLVSKTVSSAAVVGCELKANGTIYSTVEIPALTGGIQVRNNSNTDSIANLSVYNGLTQMNSSSLTGNGHPVAFTFGTSAEGARFTSSKRLGIGITAPTQALHVVGDIVATGNITAYFSDERLKDFKGTIPNALDKVSQLNGYYYTPNETAQALGVDNNGVEVGVSAQEVEAVLPEIVTDSVVGKDYKTVMYEKLTPLLIEAVKELTQKVAELESRLDKVEK